MSAQSDVREFQAETRQLLDLMVHSIYSNKDSFLRELISNSSDALDKVRLAAYTDKDLDVDTGDLHIELVADDTADARTLTVRDNGIGMSKDEVVGLIGTLARSGTAELREKLAQAKDEEASAELIGQFGIGFYSTFMVADTVTLVTRKAGETVGTRWESTGDGTYTISEAADAPQGTSVTLALKPVDTENHLNDYADEATLRRLIKKYSDFIGWPIRMDVEKTTTEPGDGEDAEPVVTTSTETETLNSMTALWAKSKEDVSEQEYNDFYRHVSHAWDDPLEVITLRAEGTFEYQALLFIPSQPPFDLFMRERSSGVQLYVKRVFIMDDCDELMPEYLRFVKGVVDAADLSLNVSREILQQDRQIRAIRRRLTKKVISTVSELRASRPADYRSFWDNFGKVFKEGLVNDPDNKDALLKASVFDSTFSASAAATDSSDNVSADDAEGVTDGPTTLADYVGRMKSGQDAIFYMTGETRAQIENSPHLEAFRAKGVEVLLLSDPVDEMWVGAGAEFEGKTFQSIAKGDVDLDAIEGDDDADDDTREAQAKEFAALLDWLGENLSGEITEARLSRRLTDSAACLVGDNFSMSPQLEKLYRASGQELPKSKRALELNANHPLIAGLRTAFDSSDDHAALLPKAQLLYGLAVIAEGGELADPAEFSRLLANSLTESVAASES